MISAELRAQSQSRNHGVHGHPACEEEYTLHSAQWETLSADDRQGLSKGLGKLSRTHTHTAKIEHATSVCPLAQARSFLALRRHPLPHDMLSQVEREVLPI